MKKYLLFIAAMLVSVLNVFPQASFSTGALEVSVSEYGRIRLFDPEGTRHLQRASILVGTASDAVFDYTNDAEALEATVLVENPLLSDYELYGSTDNTYSELPPDVIVKLHAYGWNNESYTIVKFNVLNDEVDPLTAMIGLEIIPELNQEYGFDSVTYIPESGVIRFHRGAQMNMGIKLLSADSFLSTLGSFEWYDGYAVDPDLWTWMNLGTLQPQYASSTADGPVTITSQTGVPISPQGSVDVYYALALGIDEQTLLASMEAATEKWALLFTSVDENEATGSQLNLGQNYPNPFDHSTTISYQLPSDGFVSLKIYNAIGQEMATLVSSDQTVGSYTIPCNATNLTNGMYFYTLRFNDQVKSGKMFVAK